MEQERKDLIKLIDKLDLKKKSVAKKLGCTPVELSYFLNKKRGLRVECQTRLINYLKR
jgi:predicted transcriptional regulator